MADYSNGQWHAMTPGQFVGLITDSKDEAILMRVSHDEKEKEGNFIRHLSVILIPQGQVTETLERVDVESCHNTLVKLIQAGLIK